MQHTQAHGSNSLGEVFPLAGDVSHLKLELRSGKPGVWRLRPKLAQLLRARSRLLLLLLMSGSILLLLIVHTVLTSNVYWENFLRVQASAILPEIITTYTGVAVNVKSSSGVTNVKL